jgi:hypothetical protein
VALFRKVAERNRTDDDRERLCSRIPALAGDDRQENREDRVLRDGCLEQ